MARKRNVVEAEGVETEEGVEAEAETTTRRIAPVELELVDELPDNPKRQGPVGKGQSLWVKKLASIADEYGEYVNERFANEGKPTYVKLRDYGNASGARVAMNTLNSNVAEGKVPLPEGFSWEFTVRRQDVEAEDGGTKRISRLYAVVTPAE